MSTTTTNLELIKPEATDNVSITDINENMDKIDATMSGWIPLAGTFTYSNTTTITTSVDCTSFLSAGMKIKLTNSTVKMSVIKSVTSTTIVLESAVLASGTITDVYFSTVQVPYGYSAGDFVIERGQTNGWEWEKWKSGKATFWIMDAQTTTFTQEGSLYYGDIKTLTLPFAVSNYVSTTVDCIEDYLGCITAGFNATQYRYRTFAPSWQSTRTITARIRLEVKI